MDTDKDGTVDYDELMSYIEEIMAEKCSTDDVVDAFKLIDEDGSGEVSHEEVIFIYNSSDSTTSCFLLSCFCEIFSANVVHISSTIRQHSWK